LNQVLRNVLSNAIRYSPADGAVTVCAGFVEAAEEKAVPTPVHGGSVVSAVGRGKAFQGAQMLLRVGSVVSIARGVGVGVRPAPATAPGAVHPDVTGQGAAAGKGKGKDKDKDKVLGVAGELVVAVKDTGKGMSEAEVQAVFDENKKVRS